MFFNDITGLTEEKGRLLKAIRQNHLSHALLFHGTEGAGHLALALALATYVNCTNPGEDDACGECAACSKNRKFIHPDLHFAFPVSTLKGMKAADSISKNFLKDWRQFLQQNPYGTLDSWNTHFGGENKLVNISREESRQIIQALALKTYEGAFKIMLIWLPEYMHNTAANALLKILEEPSERTIFLLVTNDHSRLLPTILSRVQLIKVRPFTDEEVAQYLIKAHNLPEEQAHQVAFLADGNMNEAIQISQTGEDQNQEIFQEWMRSCFKWDMESIAGFTEQFQKMNKINQRSMLELSLSLIREAVIHRYEPEQLLRVDKSKETFIENFSAQYDTDKLGEMTQQISEAIVHLERNANPKILFFDLSLLIAKIMRS